MTLLSEEEYFDVIDSLPAENRLLEDTDPNKFIAKMGAEALYDLLCQIDLDKESYELRDKANTETSQQRKQETLKRLKVFEAFRDSRKRAIATFSKKYSLLYIKSMNFYIKIYFL